MFITSRELDFILPYGAKLGKLSLQDLRSSFYVRPDFFYLHNFQLNLLVNIQFFNAAIAKALLVRLKPGQQTRFAKWRM
uniref:Uncharacterized protein n=1 Tax=Desertifilum tharense IPPAS B-1220 TaxID=1781255 RepID=A0A1E5QN63_9CYAN|nr:hypothetical protein BH720_06095 [Desertifilum tharense IPPAS B-1220]